MFYSKVNKGQKCGYQLKKGQLKLAECPVLSWWPPFCVGSLMYLKQNYGWPLNCRMPFN